MPRHVPVAVMAAVAAILGITACSGSGDSGAGGVQSSETTAPLSPTTDVVSPTAPLSGGKNPVETPNDGTGTAAPGGSITTTGAPVSTGPRPSVLKAGLVLDIGGRGDKSMNDRADAGLTRCQSELRFDTKVLSPSATGDNRQALLDELAKDGYSLVFAVGDAFRDPLGIIGPLYPTTRFAIIDSVADPANVTGLTFAEEQGSYLVGAAAALKSPGKRIGFLGGVEISLVKKFEAGFVAGARSVVPDVEVQVRYVTQPPDFSGLRDSAKAKVVATEMYGAGAEVIFHAADAAGVGVIDAAVASGPGRWVIGVNGDQYLSAGPEQQPHVLTSMVKNVDVAVFETCKAFAEGRLASGVLVFDAGRDGVGYATSGGFVADIADRLDGLKARIASGEILVPLQPVTGQQGGQAGINEPATGPTGPDQP